MSIAIQTPEWVGIAHTTKPKYMKGVSDLTIRKRLILSLMKQKGRIEYNQVGEYCQWILEFSQPPVESYNGSGVIDFANHDAFRTLAVDWRGYIATDTLSKKHQLMNKGEAAMVNLFQTKANRLNKSLTNKFSGELFKSGSTSGRENNVHGLETFLDVAATPNATDRIARPSSSYGLTALSTALGTYGGSWSTGLASGFPNAALANDWPDGQGDVEYDFLSPKLINWSSTAWGTSSNQWEDNAWRVISQAITWLTTTSGNYGKPDLFLLASNLWQGYKNAQEVKTRISIPHKAANDLGFDSDVLNEDGCAIQMDYDVPINTGYGLVLDTVTLSCLTPELFWMEGPDKDPRTAWSYLWGQGFYGNAKYSPKHVAKLFNYA